MISAAAFIGPLPSLERFSQTITDMQILPKPLVLVCIHCFGALICAVFKLFLVLEMVVDNI